MPSYIELDKQASLPAASNTGKVVFGINTAGEPEFTDSNGNTYNFGTGSLVPSSPYVEYLTNITQVAENAPTIDYTTINTLGFTPVWEYVEGGVYRFPFNNPIDSRKLISDIPIKYSGEPTVFGYKVANDAAITASNFSNFNNKIVTALIQPDNKILVGGIFSDFNGTGVNRIIRLNSDASIDGDFSSGTGFDDSVDTLAIQSDGKILIGGVFTTYNGTAVNRIARLDTSGSIDNTFSIGSGFGDEVNTIAIQSDGKILVGGVFSSYNGTTSSCIARINTSGSIDNTFTIGSGFNDTVNTIAIQSDGKILAGGVFTDYNGTGANYIVRINSDGSIDNTFNIGTGFDNPVNTVVIQSDGKILVGGKFTDYNGTVVGGIIRLNSDGSIDNTFIAGIFDDGAGDPTVNTVAIQFDDKILVGGPFTTYNGNSASRIARLKSNGTIDNDNFFTDGNIGFNNIVRTIVTLENGNILAGGEFTEDINTNPYSYMALINNPYSYQINTKGADGVLNQQQIYIKLYN